MNVLQKKILLPMAAVAIIGAGAYGVSQASAASDSADPRASLIQKLADTFHLDKTKVQAVFDQDRADRQTERETQYEQRLAQAVTDGKLTDAQRDAVLAEHQKLAEEIKTAMAKTGSDRRDAMDKIRHEATDWAQQHNLAAHWLLGPAFGFGHGHPRAGTGPGPDDAPPAD